MESLKEEDIEKFLSHCYGVFLQPLVMRTCVEMH